MRKIILWTWAWPLGLVFLTPIMILIQYGARTDPLMVVKYMIPAMLYLLFVKISLITRADHRFMTRACCIQMVILFCFTQVGLMLLWIAGLVVIVLNNHRA